MTQARAQTATGGRTAAIGRRRDELLTPALVVDLDVLKANIAYMAARLRDLPARLRPHIKVHKCAQVARLQIDAGAIGVATATAWEAVAMARAGMKDILVANQVVGRERIESLVAAAADARVTVAVDDVRNVAALGEAGRAAGVELGALVEVDVGMGRCGARSAEEAVALAKRVAGEKGLRFRGVQGYEGHCMLEPDRAVRIAKAQEAMAHLARIVHGLARAGFRSEVVSAGGTGTYDITGANPLVTEIQAGSYAFMDAFHGNLVSGFAPALTVQATVISRRGNTVVLDAGRKTVGVDFVPPRMVGYDYLPRYFAEEHAIFDTDERCELDLGDSVAILPAYSPTTVNLHEAYYVISRGVVVDVWPILARGSGHGVA